MNDLPTVPLPRRPLRVAFDAGHLQERGTDVALFDYAHFNETLLGNRSRILCPAQADIRCIDKFRERFSVWLYRSPTELREALQDVDVYYRIDHGADHGEPVVRPPNGISVVHAVFEARQPHGDVYAAVSDWVATRRGLGDVPAVPHIVHLPDDDGDLRDELGIPPDAVVLGRHGGPDTFDIPFVHDVVREIVPRRDDLWFVFLNTRPFMPPHPRVLHLDATSDMVRKTRFINSCDAMLHARREGETFGLSVGEFSIRNKPVLTWTDGTDNHHIDVLREKGIYYRTAEELRTLLMGIHGLQGDYDAFSERFSPAVVMDRFHEVFLEPARRRQDRPVPALV
ncbi:MAG: hypothetical protein KDB80_07775 [Planctomycetes bacterium]|nr:hypothetical protein [Planctomycetota bacterium]